MKKLTLTSLTAVAILAAAAIDASAQGTVNFASAAGGACITSNTVTGVTAKIVAGQYAFGLYVSTTGNPSLSSTPVLVVTNAGFGGVISGSILTVPGLSAGTTYSFEVAGWAVASGASDYLTAVNSGNSPYAGVSTVGSFTAGSPPGTGNTPAGHVFGSPAGNSGLVLSPVLTNVPEPSTMVLGGLGIAALAFFRRRK